MASSAMLSSPMTPGDNDDPAAWCTDSGELANKFLLVGHVLPALQ